MRKMVKLLFFSIEIGSVRKNDKITWGGGGGGGPYSDWQHEKNGKITGVFSMLT